jgi:hypothetical protein
MTTGAAEAYAELGEAAWQWVLAQVRGDDGPWIPVEVSGDEELARPPVERDGMHSGIGGLAHVLAEIRTSRPWEEDESALAEAIAVRIRPQVRTLDDCGFFDGLVSSIGVLTALGAPGADVAVARLAELAGPDGWPQHWLEPPRHLPGARINDVTLGTGAVLLGALWAHRHDVPGAGALAQHAAEVLMAESELLPSGTNWLFVPRRFCVGEIAEMPNFSHGLSGIAAALAVAGTELARPDLVAAALGGAEHLVTLGDDSAGGFVVPTRIPPSPDVEPVTYTWCHGPAGTSYLFAALERAGVDQVAGRSPAEWHRRCLTSERASGLPARVRPGFWDNDGRCCGTAGVGEVFLDSFERTGEQGDFDFAIVLADALVERTVRDGPYVYWRFLEHRNPEPLLPPGVGWMQGAAGIAAFLVRISRFLRGGPGGAPRMENWWALPAD